MSQVEQIIEDAIATFREYGYDFKAEYTLNQKGEMISVKLVLCGRLD